jgi:hypothetical protein
MKVYSEVKPEHVEATKTLAKDRGLDTLDYNAEYKLSKVSAKADGKDAGAGCYLPMQGRIVLVGNGEVVCIACMGRGFSWFRTSPIVASKLEGDDLVVETLNSFYKLTKVSGV